MTERESFSSTLRQQRERRGLTLEAVAESTKVSSHLLAALERGDLSRWPIGIYRRSFLRVYAGTIGLPPEQTLRDFLRLFPEPGHRPKACKRAAEGRITLMPEPLWRAAPRQAVAAAVDAVAVLSIGYGGSLLSGETFWSAVAVVTLAYFAAGTTLFGQSPAMRLLAMLPASRGRSSVTADLAALRRQWMAGWMAAPAKSNSGNRVTT